MSSLLLQRPATGLKMAINSWLEKVQFHEQHPLSVKLLVSSDTYQQERCIVCNDIMVPVCGLNVCEVKTWELEHFRFVFPLRASLIILLTALASFASNSPN